MNENLQEQKNKINFNITFGGVNLEQKSIFAKHMSVMLKSGLTVNEALEIAEQSSVGKLKKIIKKVLQSVRSGNNFSNSLREHPKVFPGILISAVYAGENSGTLVQNLKNVSIELEKEKKLSDKIKSSMIYPVIVLLATLILGLSLAYFILPKIIPLFSGLKTDLPITTKILIWVSEIMETSGVQIIVGTIIGIIILSWILRRKFIQPLTHFVILHTPVVNKISKNSNLARFSRTIAMLLSSGITIIEALEITIKTTPNYYYRKSLEKVLERIQTGTKLSEQLDRFPKLYPLVVTRMISVGENSGNMEDTLFYLSEFYEDEVDNSTKTLATTIEPILLLFIGLVVGWLALSIITPIYEITGNINR